MSANGSNGFLNIEDANLRVRSGNVYAKGITVGGITVGASHGLQSVSDVSNTTSNTLQFTNATTSFKATSNIEVGGDVSYTSKPKISVESNVVTEYTGPHDRPLRKYPEVALTSATTGGYTASQSSEYDNTGNYSAWKAFDSSEAPNGTLAITQSSQYNNTSGTLVYVGDKDLLGDSNYKGEWIKLELPVPIAVKKIHLQPRSTFFDQTPCNFKIAGSNDNSSWDVLYHNNPPANTIIPSDAEQVHYMTHNLTKYYKYVAIVANTTGAPNSSGTTNYLTMTVANLEYYGHEEGSASLDTTLKSVYNVPATTGTQLEVYYDGQDFSSGSTITDKVGNANATISSGSDITFDSTYKAWVFGGNASRTQTIKTGTLPTSLTGGANAKPEISAALWFNPTVWGDDTLFMIANPAFDQTDNQFLEVRLNGGQEYRIQVWDGQHAGRYNAPGFDDSSEPPPNQWYHLAVSISGKTPPNTERKVYLNGIECTFNSEDATPSGVLNLPSNSQLELGRRPDAGSGATVHNAAKEFFGSIANFRLYSKALNADQVKELYDYQKDYFLGSKSQVTLYKGHLGVGVTEPSGQLELAGDERIQEYPPRALTGYETLVEGHGVFETYSTGGLYNNGSGGNLPWTVFNKITGTFNDGTSWVSEDAAGAGAGGNYNNGGSSGYGGSHRLSSNTLLGDYLVICLPYSIVLKSYSLSNISGASGYGAADFPRDYIIYGSNDNVNWEVVDSRSDQEAGGLAPAAHVSASYPGYTNNYKVPENNKVYSKFAIVITDINSKTWYDYTGSINASYAGISEWRLFGTPGPTTLDKGSLTLGRSLDVPRISRYDVDTETPRPEKLVLDFDTTVNSSPTDISGKGNHGTFKGTASYSPAEKAFSFNGTDDYIQGTLNLNGSELDGSYTLSAWVKRSSTTNNESFLFYIGTDGTGDSIGFYSDSVTSYKLFHYNATTAYATSQPSILNTYRHIVATYDGTYRRIYIDGVMIDVTNTDVSAPLGIPNNPTFSLGMRYTNLSDTQEFLHGYMSNPKIYSVALEPSEVKKLYNLGRTGRSMVISDTAVGIGKVPEAQLDVRGNINSAGIMTNKNYMFWATGPSPVNTQNDHPTTQIVADFSGLEFDLGGGFDTSTKTYTIPCSGYWEFDYCILARNRAAGVNYVMGRWLIDGSILDKRTFVYFVGTGSGSQESDLVGKIIGYYTAGTTVAVQIVQDSANTDAYMSPNYSFFYGKMLH